VSQPSRGKAREVKGEERGNNVSQPSKGTARAMEGKERGNTVSLPSRGTAREVGGMISARRRKNTVSESRMEMQRVT
jgi:hypothetical protein